MTDAPIVTPDPLTTHAPADEELSAPASLRRMVHRLERQRSADPLAERLEPLAVGLSRGSTGDLLRGEWLGHALHPLLTDLPVGCWLSATLLDLVGGQQSAVAAQRLIGLGLLAVPPTAASGLVDWDASAADERVRRVGAVHGAGNGLVALVYLASWWSRRRGHRGRGILLGLAGGSLAMATAYLGGHLSFARAAGQGERGRPPAQARGDEDATIDATIDLTRAPGEPREPVDRLLDG